MDNMMEDVIKAYLFRKFSEKYGKKFAENNKEYINTALAIVRNKKIKVIKNRDMLDVEGVGTSLEDFVEKNGVNIK